MAYSHEYYLKNKERICARTRKRQKLVADRRRELLSVYPCICCGNSDPDVIQWHHVDPSEKEKQVIHNGISEEDFWDEVLKCVPVCANCHVKIHKGTICLIPPKLR